MTGPAGTALLLADNPWQKRIVCVSTGGYMLALALHYSVAEAAIKVQRGLTWLESAAVEACAVSAIAHWVAVACSIRAYAAVYNNSNGSHATFRGAICNEVVLVLCSRYWHCSLPLLLAAHLLRRHPRPASSALLGQCHVLAAVWLCKHGQVRPAAVVLCQQHLFTGTSRAATCALLYCCSGTGLCQEPP